MQHWLGLRSTHADQPLLLFVHMVTAKIVHSTAGHVLVPLLTFPSMQLLLFVHSDLACNAYDQTLSFMLTQHVRSR